MGWNLIPSAPLVIVMSSGGRSVASTVSRVPSARTMPSWTVSPAWSRRVRPGLPNPSSGVPFRLTTWSPTASPAAAAGLPVWTSSIVRTQVGLATDGDREEDRERQDEVHHDAGDEDDHLLRERRADERARIVRVAVLALEPDEAADRQPVERVERLALRPEDLRPGREPDPELVDADAGQAGDHEVAELVDDDEHAEHQHEDDDRDRALDDRAHRAGLMGDPCRAVGRPDLGVEGDQLIEVRCLVGTATRTARRPPRASGRSPGSRACRRGSARRRPRRPR